MKRRNFFKALAAVAVVPILPKPKDGSEYIEFECNLSRCVRHYGVQGCGHYVGMYSPKGEMSHSFYGDAIDHPISFPRHGVHSWEFIDRHIE